jgi:hypothetical protein
MAYDSFEIKYLFELYPNTDFTEEFVTCQEVQELPSEYESQATSEKWGWSRDSITANRLIQTYKKRKYEVIITLSRNIDAGRLQVGQTTLTTAAGETFIIYDVNINYQKIENTLDYVLTISFFRYDDDIINHLSSDNVLTYKTEQSVNVTELSYDVIKPEYTAYVDIVYDSGAKVYQFQIPISGDYSKLSIAERYYVHVFDPTFDSTNNYFAYINSVVGGVATFTMNYIHPSPTGDFGNTYVTINQNAGELTTEATVESNTITHSFTIYSFLSPIYDFVITETDGNLPFELAENQRTNSKKRAKLKAWLTEDELYKFEQIHHALPENITLTLSDGSTTIVPQQTKGILNIVEKDSIIRLYEIEITILYNNKTVSFFR